MELRGSVPGIKRMDLGHCLHWQYWHGTIGHRPRPWHGSGDIEHMSLVLDCMGSVEGMGSGIEHMDPLGLDHMSSSPEHMRQTMEHIGSGVERMGAGMGFPGAHG